MARRGGTKTGRGRKAAGPAKAKTYKHKDPALLRPEIGLQEQFKKKKPPKTYRYDRSLDPALSWDENPAREEGEAAIREILAAKGLPAEVRSAAERLKAISKPFLNWAGKAERPEISVPTLPLFVHERLSTQAILETVKSRKRDKQQSFAFFADEEMTITDRVLRAYEHKGPWANRMILGDSLVVMNSLLEYEGLGGKVQMIYMDPPYGVKFGSNFQPFVRRRDVKHGDDQHLTREPEMVQAYRDTWEVGLHSYLTYLRDRLLLCRELLAPTGSVFVQISDENVHHVRELMDEVFKAKNFIGLIPFYTTSSQTTDYLASVADYVLWYAKDREQTKYRPLFLPKDPKATGGWGFNYVELTDGTRRPLTKEERRGEAPLPGGRLYQLDNLVSQGATPTGTVEFKFKGKKYHPGPRSHWKTSVDGLQRLASAGRIEESENQIRYVRFLDDFAVQPMSNVWMDTTQAGYVDEKLYVVQTLAKVMQRCLLMTTDPGDLVIDPTCGSGTTAYVAEEWGRRWITIDTSRVPLALARQRLLTATFPYYELRDEAQGPAGRFVYRRKQNKKGEEVGGIVPHVTLGSIARGEPPAEEVLVDRPEVVKGVTRVTGPFVVEATIPTPMDVPEGAAEPTVPAPAEAADAGDHVSRMIEVLKRSPVVRLPGNRSVTFANVRRPARAMDIHAEATVVETTLEDAVREVERQKSLEMKSGPAVAFVFGPENGAVSEAMILRAAKEANAKNYTHLYVVGFTSQAGAKRLLADPATAEAALGIPATYVEAAMDIQMSDLLKTTRASQIFSVTGSPDVRLVRLKKTNGNGPLYRVELRGFDTFDPVTMDADHRTGDDVPCWLLDTDYNERVFCVSQAFFPRTSAWDALKRALKGTYEDSVWEHLAGTVSEPFEAGENGRIAVKVIDDRGNELLVVKSIEEAEAEK